MSTSTERRISLGQGRARELPRASRARRSVDFDPAAARAGQAARVPDQRLRVLRRHALARRAGRRRERAPRLGGRGLARGAVLRRARARRAGADRRDDAPARGRRPDEVYDEAARHFDEHELGQLMFAIIAINAWNRLGVATQLPSGLSRAPVERRLRLRRPIGRAPALRVRGDDAAAVRTDARSCGRHGPASADIAAARCPTPAVPGPAR